MVVAPHIVEANEEYEHLAKYGKRTELLCPIEGEPEPVYRWLKNGIEYNGYGSLTKKIIFPRVIIEDKATYTCVAKNRAGSQQVSIRLEASSIKIFLNFALEIAKKLSDKPTENHYS